MSGMIVFGCQTCAFALHVHAKLTEVQCFDHHLRYLCDDMNETQWLWLVRGSY